MNGCLCIPWKSHRMISILLRSFEKYIKQLIREEKKTSVEWITYLSGRKKKALDSIPSIQEVTYVFV